MLKNSTISAEDEKRAMIKSINPAAKEIEKNSPIGVTGRLKRLSKTVKREGIVTVGKIRTTAFYDLFQEFGTSKQKHHVGYFERSIDRTTSRVLSILAKELLSKIK